MLLSVSGDSKPAKMAPAVKSYHDRVNDYKSWRKSADADRKSESLDGHKLSSWHKRCFLQFTFRETNVRGGAVSQNPKVAFNHNFKAGGTSVNKWLKKNVGAEHFTVSRNRKWEPYFFDEEYFKFAFIRAPHTRFLSGYLEVNERDTHHNMLYHTQKDKYQRIHYFIREMSKENGFFDHHLWPQVVVLNNQRGEPISYDYIAQMERMGDELRHVAKALNISISWEMENRRKADQKKVNLKVSWKVIALEDRLRVCRLYAIDYCCFHFTLPPGCESVEDELPALCPRWLVEPNKRPFKVNRSELLTIDVI